jgi:acetyl-CoA synthetase
VTTYPEICKRVEFDAVAPNLRDYDQACASFSWHAAQSQLEGLPHGQGLNIAHEAVDRHALSDRKNHIALRWISRSGDQRDFSFAELSELSSRFCNALVELGVAAGDRVFALLGRVPELYVTALGTWKNRSVFCPIFSAFGPEPIATRLTIGAGRVLVTSSQLYQRKVCAIRERLPNLEHVILIDQPQPAAPGTRLFAELVAAASPQAVIQPTDPEDPAVLHFTSGTTGTPKGALHVHAAVLAHHITGKFALDLHPEDVFWCTADPGWVTGTSYGIIAPLTNGVTSIVDESEFDALHWYQLLQDQQVSVWYTAPTAIRMLMRAGTDMARRFSLPRLRFLASVGEPLNPEAVVWGQQAFGVPFHDNWWQTETGGIMIANFASMNIRPGSMGRPLPGIRAALVRAIHDETLEFVDQPGTEGELALQVGWPSMFRAYWGEEERYRKCFHGEYYLTGDLAKRDADGYYWFVGRKDDVIKTSGHLIGPFEVESALMEHPAVAEAGVIGKPDPVAMEVIKAFVVLKPGYEAAEPLRRELLGFARARLGAVVAPKEIAFAESLPKTRSGKIMRRVLKARELGLPEGDLSALEQS